MYYSNGQLVQPRKWYECDDEDSDESCREKVQNVIFYCCLSLLFGSIVVLFFVVLFCPMLVPIPTPRQVSSNSIILVRSHQRSVHLRSHLTFHKTWLGNMHLPVGMISSLTDDDYGNGTDPNFVKQATFGKAIDSLTELHLVTKHTDLIWDYQNTTSSSARVSNFYRPSWGYQQTCTVFLENDPYMDGILRMKPNNYRCIEDPDSMSLTFDEFEIRRLI